MNILTSLIIIIEQTIILFSFITFLTEVYKGVKFNLSTKLVILCFSVLMSTIGELLTDDLSFLVYIVSIIPLFTLCKYFLKCSNGFSTVCTTVLLLFISLSEMMSYFTLKLLLGVDYKLFFTDYFTIGMFHIVKFIFYILLFRFAYKLLARTHEVILKVIDSLTVKELSIMLLLVFSILFPNIIKFNLDNNEYTLNMLALSIIQLSIVTCLIYLYFKYIHFYIYAECELKQEKIYNKTLIELSDNLRLLKHDYNNILQAINGYIVTKQYDQLENHIKRLTNDTKLISNIEVINPDIINQPAIYGIIGSKYFTAKNKNIDFKLSINTHIDEISFDFTDLSKILGILLDNAIEASEKSNRPQVSINFSFNKAKQADIIEIKNTIDANSKIDINKIFNKGVSSKKIKSGLGLWEVEKIISSKANSQIFTSIENNEFSQTIVVEKC